MNSRIRSTSLSLSLSLILGACSADAPTGVPFSGSLAFSEMAPPPFCQPLGDSTTPAFGDFYRYWGCYHVITVSGPSAIVTPAINEWNAALLPDSFPGLPRFQYVTTGADINVVVDGNGSGLYCGDTFVVDSHFVHLKLHTPVGSPCTSNWSDAITTLKHELGHVLGYQSGAHKIPPPYCTFFLPDDHSINGTVCQHEVEGVLSAYSFRPTPSADTNFWTKPIVTGLTTSPASVSVAVGDSQLVSVTQYRFGRQNGAQPVAVGSASFSWRVKNEQVATVSSNHYLKGKEAGTTQLIIANPSPFPASYQQGARFGGWGHEIPVAVSATPGGFHVSAVNGAPIPITTTGTYPLSATVVNAPVGTLTIRWLVTYSNGVIDTVDTGYGPNSYPLPVPAGSYYIEVTATPRVGAETGWPVVAHYPVCTGQGNQHAPQRASGKPGGDSDKVNGC
ncbi:MAG TPA: Ig-like domain-containing protein [Gemmatimonadales bacterium]|nr:Ig-like domain-containing protein [Gemmatimonadales bacterium]HMU62048.1 Ig-like domain-containing protein [Gemmatimonadales bacterium]